MNNEQSDEPRVEMKPAGAATGYVDGGWWPRSTDPAEEFPGLVGALHGHVGQVSRVAYNLDFWAPVHRKLLIDGRVVRCEGFHTMNPHTVTAIGTNSQRVTLLVTPPDTPEDVARAVLRSAADQDSVATVEDILAGNGGRADSPPVTRRRTPVADAIPGQRWEDEGGTVNRNDQVPTNSVR
ncbi:MAG: DUF5994 family protein [Actinophytocola sp.]|uniref:DUF5994 family protein n=1 Tax=Actinophytocola sp. TaxID=1872138 RepID=UPI003C70BEEC